MVVVSRENKANSGNNLFGSHFDIGLFNPYVRYVHMHCNTSKMHNVPERSLYDFGLIFVQEGELVFEYEGRTVVLGANDLHIMPPGIRHKEYIRNGAGCRYVNIHFDMVYCGHRRNWSVYKMYLNACCENSRAYVTPDEAFVDADNINNHILSEPFFYSYDEPEEIQHIINAICVANERLLFDSSEENELRLKKYMLDLLLYVFAPIERLCANRSETVVSLFIEYVHEDITRTFDYNAFAKSKGYSPNYFRKIFKDVMHVTPWEYVKQIRLRKARQLLREGILTVKEVAVGVGFEDAFYFSKFFKKEVGCAPSEYHRYIGKKENDDEQGAEKL